MRLKMMVTMFSWVTFKRLYERSYQLLLSYSALYIGQYSKQRVRINSFDLRLENRKFMHIAFLRCSLERLTEMFFREHCAHGPVQEKVHKSFLIRFNNVSLENDNLRCSTNEPNCCILRRTPCTQPRITVLQAGSIKHIF